MIFSDLHFSAKSCSRSSSSSLLATDGGAGCTGGGDGDATSDGKDADVRWPTRDCGVRCDRDARGGGEVGDGCVGVDRPLEEKRNRKKRESLWGAMVDGEGARQLSRSEPGESGTPSVSPSSMLAGR